MNLQLHVTSAQSHSAKGWDFAEEQLFMNADVTSSKHQAASCTPAHACPHISGHAVTSISRPHRTSVHLYPSPASNLTPWTSLASCSFPLERLNSPSCLGLCLQALLLVQEHARLLHEGLLGLRIRVGGVTRLARHGLHVAAQESGAGFHGNTRANDQHARPAEHYVSQTAIPVPDLSILTRRLTLVFD